MNCCKHFPLILLMVNALYLNATTDSIWGIDVSHHQGMIHWSTIEKQGASFAYIKASEGATFKDSLFLKNVLQAKQTALKIGAYHYFSLCKQGMPQANNFIEALSCCTLDLPPVVDVEYQGNCRKRPPVDQLIEELTYFITQIEKLSNVKPILYTTLQFYHDYLKNHFKKHPIWIRSIGKEPSLPNHRSWTFWQYQVAPIKGIRGPADHNRFNGTKEQLDGLCIDSHNNKE